MMCGELMAPLARLDYTLSDLEMLNLRSVIYDAPYV